jgi:hypothetical protein
MFANPSTAARETVAAPGPARPSGPAARSYFDPESKKTFPSLRGHALYRAPATRTLRVVRLADLGQLPETSDWPEGACGSAGLGVVTPECERKRRADQNPLAR